MANMTVVRNNPHSRNTVGATERHNERKNETYSNVDVVVEQSHNNVFFKKCEDTYLQTFDKLVADKIIRVRGLQSDAHIMGEMIFDVNTRYFEENGGYEFAKKFYEDAHKFAVGLVGDERYVISSVMHADERNKAISDELGKDVYHYHLHIVYVPVVEKEIYFSKRSKDKAGQLKEVIQQVSHSKKWKSTIENGEMTKSYSKLQDDFWEHMRSAGYEVERGKEGSTAKNLTVLEYKTQQENNRLQDLILKAMAQEEVLAEYDKKIGSKKETLANYDQRLNTKKEVALTAKELKNIGKPTLLGNEVKVSNEDFNKLKQLAKKGIDMQDENADLKKELKEVKIKFNEHATAHNTLVATYKDLQSRFDNLQKEFKQFKDRVKPYLDAVKHAPERVKEFISGILEERKQERQRTKKHDRDVR